MIIAVTGHRPKDLFGYQTEQPYWALQRRIEEAIADIARWNHLPFEAIELRTGGAQGADMTAFRAGKDLGCVSHIFVPFAGQDSRWRKDGLFGQDDYQRLIRIADDLTFVDHTEKYSNATSAVEKLMNRNKAMLDGADILLAVCKNDDWMTCAGGTAATMKMAKLRNIPIHRINPMNGEREWV